MMHSYTTRATRPPEVVPSVAPDVAPDVVPDVVPGQYEKALRETLPPYRVVLHDDDVNEMGHVVHALLASVPELDERRATEVMVVAHTQGQADVITCPLERAELYRDRLKTFGLSATVERA